jgi:uncharacterized membrane protein
MINFGLDLASILGLILLLFGLVLVPLSSALRHPSHSNNRSIYLSFAGLYFLCGAILFLQGWRLDTILLRSQVGLIVASVYLLINNMLQRS